MVVSDEQSKAIQRLPRKRGGKVNFFFENLRLVPETSAPNKEHFKLVFGSGTSDPAKIRPLKVGPPPEATKQRTRVPVIRISV